MHIIGCVSFLEWLVKFVPVGTSLVPLVGIPITIKTLRENLSYRPSLERKIEHLIDFAEKLPEYVYGAEQLKNSLVEATFNLAYSLEFPRSSRYVVAGTWLLATIALGSTGIVLGLTVAPPLAIMYCVFLPLQFIGGYFWGVADANYKDTVRLTRDIFHSLRGASGILDPAPSWSLRRRHQPTVHDVFNLAKQVQKKYPGTTAVDAINTSWPVAQSRLLQGIRDVRKAKRKIFLIQARYQVTTLPIRLRMTLSIAWWWLREKAVVNRDPEAAKSSVINREMTKSIRSLYVQMMVNHRIQDIVDALDDEKFEIPKPANAASD